ncbi:cytochrome d ubiquinol oxidase subunit II [Mucilaginibacter sp. SG538B]|nr:cytochrome d ubiquinol oxidase subunit II [Mucilaginibacter sp. SG538B]
MVTGGADFGAGIVELFTVSVNRKQLRGFMSRAMGPIWEANNMWLIIAIVILFVGFPSSYSFMSTYLYIPLTGVLLGIIGRGTAFAFRNNDAVIDKLQLVYNFIYITSSILTPFCLGLVAASLFSGTIDPEGKSFADVFVFGWLNWFTISVGLFTVALCGNLASLYMIGDADNGPDRFKYVKTAAGFTIITLILAVSVYMIAKNFRIVIFKEVMAQTIGLIGVVLAIVSFITMWVSILRKRTVWIRILVGFQVFVLQAFLFWHRFPTIIVTKSGLKFTVFDPLVQPMTIHILGIALLAGGLVILPSLIYLIFVFEWHIGDREKQPFKSD